MHLCTAYQVRDMQASNYSREKILIATSDVFCGYKLDNRVMCLHFNMSSLNTACLKSTEREPPDSLPFNVHIGTHLRSSSYEIIATGQQHHGVLQYFFSKHLLQLRRHLAVHLVRSTRTIGSRVVTPQKWFSSP